LANIRVIFENNSEPAAESVKKACSTGISRISHQFDIREEQGAPNCPYTERAIANWEASTLPILQPLQALVGILPGDGGISYGLIQSLREKHINVVDYKPKGDKQERLISQIDLFQGGSVLLPKDAPWLEAFVAELLSFPGRHDDQVDALAQGLAWRREAWKGPLVQRTTFGMTS
jgi:predicted phage terminase large subunit-like protein